MCICLSVQFVYQLKFNLCKIRCIFRYKVKKNTLFLEFFAKFPSLFFKVEFISKCLFKLMSDTHLQHCGCKWMIRSCCSTLLELKKYFECNGTLAVIFACFSIFSWLHPILLHLYCTFLHNYYIVISFVIWKLISMHFRYVLYWEFEIKNLRLVLTCRRLYSRTSWRPPGPCSLIYTSGMQQRPSHMFPMEEAKTSPAHQYHNIQFQAWLLIRKQSENCSCVLVVTLFFYTARPQPTSNH